MPDQTQHQLSLLSQEEHWQKIDGAKQRAGENNILGRLVSAAEIIRSPRLIVLFNQIRENNVDSPEMFTLAVILFGSMLFILNRRQNMDGVQRRRLAAASVLGIAAGLWFKGSHAGLVQILMKYTPWTLLGGHLLSLSIDGKWSFRDHNRSECQHAPENAEGTEKLPI